MSNESKTENDAIHPRFAQALTSEERRHYQRNDYYYCNTCEIYFGASVDGLKYHFNGKIVNHSPYSSCLYCKGPVYNYFYRGVLKVYHNCNKSGTSTEN